MRLSPTALRTFVTCPRQFRYYYVEKRGIIVTPALLFGRAIHETLYDIHAAQIEHRQHFELANSLAVFQQHWNTSDHTEYTDLASRILAAYIQRNRTSQIPLAMEYRFELPIPLERTEVLLCGVIDRLDEDRDGIRVVEYKTGKRKPAPRDLRMDLQLTCYAYAVWRLFDQRMVSADYYHLRSASRLVTERSPRNYDRLTQHLLPRVVSACQRNRFTAHFGWWCRFCEYRRLCDAEGPSTVPLPVCPVAL